jgi:hypothetical protein
MHVKGITTTHIEWDDQCNEHILSLPQPNFGQKFMVLAYLFYISSFDVQKITTNPNMV